MSTVSMEVPAIQNSQLQFGLRGVKVTDHTVVFSHDSPLMETISVVFKVGLPGKSVYNLIYGLFNKRLNF